MKNQTLFSLKNKSKKFICCLLQFLFGPLRVKFWGFCIICSVELELTCTCISQLKIEKSVSPYGKNFSPNCFQG